MPIRRTILITFGHRHGEPPPSDYEVDLRGQPIDDYRVWEEIAKHIVKEIEPGSVVAIGCEDGDDRSVHVAMLVKKHMGDVEVVHRDLSPSAGEKE